MSDEDGYNGWTNYETWCVNLWLSNDQGLDEMTRELVAGFDEDSPMHDIADALEDFVEDLPECAEVREKASFVSDLLGAALSEVNWYEIATAWVQNAMEAV